MSGLHVYGQVPLKATLAEMGRGEVYDPCHIPLIYSILKGTKGAVICNLNVHVLEAAICFFGNQGSCTFTLVFRDETMVSSSFNILQLH